MEHVCDGFDEQWDNCGELPKCGPCVPKDCVLGEWAPWQTQGGCTGLQVRTRDVEVASNECGKPCVGALTETAKSATPANCLVNGQDCKFSAWSDWSQCQDKKDQSMRNREVVTLPSTGGKDCQGALQETRPCGGPSTTDCLFGPWHEWTTCSASCGEGRYTRLRYVDEESHHGGETCNDMLLQTAPCVVQMCPRQDCVLSTWEDWSDCDEVFSQRFRQRNILTKPLGNGAACEPALQETVGCPAALQYDCVIADWQEWSVCDRTCGGGQQYRERNLRLPASDGGTCPQAPLKEAARCNSNPCYANSLQDCAFTEWESWTPCSASCGMGSHRRTRKIQNFAAPTGNPCNAALMEASLCKTHECHITDCRWSDWEQWSSCTVTCDGGTRTRTRNIAVSPEGGRPCEPKDKVEVEPCSTQMCGEGCIDGVWGQWREWTPCSGGCDNAYRYRRRSIERHPNYCGNVTQGIREEFQKCAPQLGCFENKDCQVSEWDSWTTCSCHCFGVRHRSRYITVFPSGNGKPCYDQSLKEMDPCNPGVGEDTPMDCTNVRQQDCRLKDWDNWSECSVPKCGGGQRSRIREVEQHATGGGRPCDSVLMVTEGCNTQRCEETKCQDCVWGPWSPWGKCPPCGGQRYRHRSIERMPNHCGQRCAANSAKQVDDCPMLPECVRNLYCAWSEWSEPDCSGKCGAASTMISRSLGFTKTRPWGLDGVFFKVFGEEKCAGTQVNQTVCNSNTVCDRCDPIPCEFADWSEWQEPTCDGLCERSRTVLAINNECGDPCRGALTETKQCEADCNKPRDCLLSPWDSWGQCSDPGQSSGQRYRSREILVSPQHGGKPCLGVLEETIGCQEVMPQPCTLTAWSQWTPCSVSCGSGWHSRIRTIQEHAQRGGFTCDGSLKEIDECQGIGNCGSTDSVDCQLGDWQMWSSCDVNHMQFRDRQILRPARNGGKSCAGQVNQGRSCGFEPVNCVMSDWTTWNACDRTCGEAQQQRQRQIAVFPKNGGRACPDELMQTQGCVLPKCQIQNTEVSDWGSWGDCSKTCGPGTQRRSRQILALRSPGGRGYEGVLGQVRECQDTPACKKSDCVWGDWQAWGGCSCTCGGGEQSRVRIIKSWPEGGGQRCEAGSKSEVRGCNMQKCDSVSCQDGKWDDWTPWSQCSSSCDGGTTRRTRKLATMANACGCPPPGKDEETAFCNVDRSCEPSLDCRFFAWTDWTPCTATCNGIKRRARSVEQYGKGLGVWCSGGLQQIYPCNPSPGEEPKMECAGGTPVDCEESAWTAWSVCSVTCGGGEVMRSRYILKMPAFGGRPCGTALVELKECARNDCNGPNPVDCAFGTWEEWGACDKCNGERKRRRKIIAYPRNGGKECDPKVIAEVGKCPRRCAEQKYCEWANWDEWSPCTAACGKGGKRRRRRYMELTALAKAQLPDYIANVLNEYQKLTVRAKELEYKQFIEILVSFTAGCLSIFVVAAVVRSVSRSRPSYSLLDSELGLAEEQ